MLRVVGIDGPTRTDLIRLIVVGIDGPTPKERNCKQDCSPSSVSMDRSNRLIVVGIDGGKPKIMMQNGIFATTPDQGVSEQKGTAPKIKQLLQVPLVPSLFIVL